MRTYIRWEPLQVVCAPKPSAINEKTGEIRSGQAELPAEYVYYIIKFNEGKKFPFTLVEMAYYLMANAAGINMMPSRLIEIDGRQHFLTQRFDRLKGKRYQSPGV
ncbi:HipA domain-containing protein [uncultured Prevotella sp.]|uniref:HipA domain-containing protein n=1 Tax=uncultured Prevotella sp. TaxID=159272 RepID=UPI002584E307|nr:HipA domain-containing protein [uncultured Prevotella sp.]